MKFRARLYLPFMFGLGLLAAGSVWLLGSPGNNGTGTTEAPQPPPLPEQKLGVVEQTFGLANAAQTRAGAPQAVKVGGTADLDACASTGKVVHLDPAGDNFLAVRAAPQTSAEETDRLQMGADVYLCDRAGGGAWTGIVYGPGGTLEAGCGVTSPIEKRDAYIGTCRSGWVSSRYIELIAG